MAIGNLFGSGGESNSLYGTSLTSGGSIPAASSFIYFEWFIFKTSSAQPATPTGGTWDFLTNTGTPPTGWTSTVSGIPLDSLWFSIAFVDSRNPTNFTWSTPGLISATTSIYATAYADTFTGTGSTTNWTLTTDPVVVNNLDVSINGVTQTPTTDYTISGTTFTTTTAAPLGSIILVKYRQALPNSYFGTANNVGYTPSGWIAATNVQSALNEVAADISATDGVSGSNLVGYKPAGTGAVATTVQAKLRESVSVLDFGANTVPGTTDMTAAFTSAASMFSSGYPVIIPPGQYLLTSQVTFNAPNTVRGLLTGYGAEIFTSGSISAIKIAGNTNPHGVTVRGITVNHRNNTTATYGFEAVGTSHAEFVDCIVEANNCQANYAAFVARNTIASDADTGAFWTDFIHCQVRKRSGSDAGTIPIGILLKGAANGSRVLRCDLGAVTCVKLQSETGQTRLPNGVLINENAFEGFTTAVLVEQTTAACSGLRLCFSRVEAGTTFYSQTMSGTMAQPAVPALLFGNYGISSVTNYIVNSSGQYLSTFDFSITPANFGPVHVYNSNSMVYECTDATYPALDARIGSGGLGKGIRVSSASAVPLFEGNYVASGKFELTGVPGVSLYPKTVLGISQSATRAENLAGYATFSAATTKTVTFATAEADALYRVLVTWTSDPGASNTRWWVSSKTTTGFTLNVPASTSASFDWLIVHD